MAYSVGNYNQAPMGSGTDFHAHRLILKPELRKTWYLYATKNGSQFRPYPVFDAQGNPCSPAGVETDNPIDLLPECFAALKIVLFAGLDKNLEFVNYCSDLDSYVLPGREGAYTPYDYLYSGMKKMLPMKSDPSRTPDGYPTPRALATMAGAYGVARSTNAIICRGTLITHDGSPLTVKAAQESGGSLFTAVIAITQKGCCDSLMSLLKRVDLSRPLAGDNVMLRDMFNINGTVLCTRSVAGGKAGERGQASVERQQASPGLINLVQSVMGATDDASYWAALRNAFGPAQAIGDIFNIMTAEEMINALKDTHPISWVWYALKDSPYADFISAEDRQQAMADPEMAPRFGVAPAAQAVSSNPFMGGSPAGVPKAASVFAAGGGVPAPAPAPTTPPAGGAFSPQPTAPNWNPAPVGGGSIEDEGGLQRPAASPFPGYQQPATPAVHAGTAPTGGGDVPPTASPVNNDALARLQAKYSGMSKPEAGDGIKY